MKKGKSFLLDNVSGAINKKGLKELAFKNANVDQHLKKTLERNFKMWEKRMFAINISFNGSTPVMNKSRSRENVNAQVNTRILFSL